MRVIRRVVTSDEKQENYEEIRYDKRTETSKREPRDPKGPGFDKD